MAAELDGTALKTKQRALRDGFDKALGLRVHRSISWIRRAETETSDDDVRFVLLWIAFNAAYASEIVSNDAGERSAFSNFFERLVHLDGNRRIYDAVWKRFSQEIRTLLDNRFVFAPFWNFQNGVASCADWPDRMARSSKITMAALGRGDTALILSVVFDRLYVLRNQLVHGGATWNGAVNRAQVKDGAAILGWLLPIFVDTMMDHPGEPWGMPYYPVVE